MNAGKAIAEFVGRAVIGLTFVYWGGRKLVDVLGFGPPGGGAGWAEYMERFGVPGELLPLVILTELGGGLLLIVGLYTRVAAIALAGFCVLANFFVHSGFELPPPTGHFNWIILIKNFALAGGLLVVAANGAAAWSLDQARRTRKQEL